MCLPRHHFCKADSILAEVITASLPPVNIPEREVHFLRSRQESWLAPVQSITDYLACKFNSLPETNLPCWVLTSPIVSGESVKGKASQGWQIPRGPRRGGYPAPCSLSSQTPPVMSLPTRETPISEKQQNPKIASSKFSLQLKGPGGWAWKFLVGAGSFKRWAARDAVWVGVLKLSTW